MCQVITKSATSVRHTHGDKNVNSSSVCQDMRLGIEHGDCLTEDPQGKVHVRGSQCQYGTRACRLPQYVASCSIGMTASKAPEASLLPASASAMDKQGLPCVHVAHTLARLPPASTPLLV